MRHTIFIISCLSALFLHSCKESVQESASATSETVTDSSALADIIEEESTEAHYLDAQGMHEVHNERYGFTFVIPVHFKATDKSNNGDGYFIETGDQGVDIRVYGESIADNALMAELALQSCTRTEKFRFANGYPGTKCFQSADIYYYYDTPTTRITLYVHAPERWMQRNAHVAEEIAKSISYAGTPFN